MYLLACSNHLCHACCVTESLNVCIDIIWNWMDLARVGIARDIQSVSSPEIEFINKVKPQCRLMCTFSTTVLGIPSVSLSMNREHWTNGWEVPRFQDVLPGAGSGIVSERRSDITGPFGRRLP
jgi:hypothetical protein